MDKGEGSSNIRDDKDIDSKREKLNDQISRLKLLRQSMRESSKANRKAVSQELNDQKKNNNMSSSRKVEKAQRLLDERDAKERGEDFERIRNWNYTIEDQEKWQEKLEEKELKKEKDYVDPMSNSERSYKRLISQIKPNFKDPKENNELEDASSNFTAHLSHGTHKPSEEALDRLTMHLNNEEYNKAKRSRKNSNDDQDNEEITYINSNNQRYNKKLKKFFDGHVKEIRENLERGTAL